MRLTIKRQPATKALFGRFSRGQKRPDRFPFSCDRQVLCNRVLRVTAAGEQLRKRGSEKDGHGLRRGGAFSEEQAADGFDFDGSATEGDDGLLVFVSRIEHAGDSFRFEAAEVRLPVIGEYPGDGAVMLRGDQESISRKGQRRRAASIRPTVDLPAPMKPVRTMRRGRAAGPDGPWLIFVGLEPLFCFSEVSEV